MTVISNWVTVVDIAAPVAPYVGIRAKFRTILTTTPIIVALINIRCKFFEKITLLKKIFGNDASIESVRIPNANAPGRYDEPNINTMIRSLSKKPAIAKGIPRASIIVMVFSNMLVVFSVLFSCLDRIGKREIAINDGIIEVNCTRRCPAAYNPTSAADLICPSMMLSMLKINENKPMMISGHE